MSSTFDSTLVAIQRVAKMHPDFKKVSLEKRLVFLENFLFQLVKNKSEILQKLQEAQKIPLAVAELEHVESLDYLHFFKQKLKNESDPRNSLGPVVCFGSWSSPLLRLSESLVTALTLGNTALLHCSDSSQPLYQYFLDLLVEAGFPSESMGLFHGQDSEALELLYEHPAFRGIHFHGHAYEGEFLKNKLLPLRRKHRYHFGGHNPVIFLYDADLRNLADLVRESLQFSYLGEMRFNRWFVQEKIYPEFTESLKDIFNSQPDLVSFSSPHAEYSARYAQQMKNLLKEKNWWNPVAVPSEDSLQLPTFVNLDFNNCSAWQQQETLGPVLTVTRFKNSAEALKFCNTTFYANAGAVISQDLEKARNLGSQLSMPLVTLNRLPQRTWDKPLWSSYESGFGNETLPLDFYSQAKITTAY